jgi:putative oxidoreductase
MSTESRLATPLLTLRLGVFIVMLMWTLDKFVNPAHAGAVFENFYMIGGLGDAVFLAIGIVELAIIVAFVLGIKKTITYGIVLALHTVSTLSSWQQYLGFDSLLFFAAWPMLAACYTLFMLRDLDTKLTLANLA